MKTPIDPYEYQECLGNVTKLGIKVYVFAQQLRKISCNSLHAFPKCQQKSWGLLFVFILYIHLIHFSEFLLWSVHGRNRHNLSLFDI